MRRRAREPRPTPAERNRAVGERKTRAVEEPLDVRLRTREVYPILEVRNPLHGTAYRVLLPEFPGAGSALCTCTDFARRGLGTCKHIEAGVAWLGEHPASPPLLPPRRGGVRSATVWKEVDRRISEGSRAGMPESERVRRAGAVLFERRRGEPDP